MDAMHGNHRLKVFTALHEERVRVVPFHPLETPPLENSHSSDVCCSTTVAAAGEQ